uniref:Odorant receptor n=1 Tax=Sirex nitobei TaxID=1602346 RepID=A0A857N9A4_9HYME|nr:odorant receptor 35 [Sirex nitobei]
MMCGTVCGQFVSLVHVFPNLDKIMDVLYMFIAVSMVLFKLVITYNWHWKKLKFCLDFLDEDWLQVTHAWEKEIMRTYARYGRLFNIFFMSNYTATWVFVVSQRIYDYLQNKTTKDHIFKVRYFFDVHMSPNFELVFAYQFIQGTATTLCNGGVDGILVIFIYHLYGQLEILKRKLINLLTFYKANKSIISQHSFNKQLGQLIQRHLQLIHFASVVEETFNFMILGQLFVSSLIMCVLGFRIIMTVEDSDLAILVQFILFQISMTTEIFIYCYCGEKIISQSQSVSYAVYETEWFDCPAQVAKMLLVLMIRTKQSLCITAGKLYVMNLENFTSILKTSLSYLSVLRTIKD